jgi:hypothetical protein
MSKAEGPEPADRVTAVLSLLGRLTSAAGAIIASRANQFAAIERREVGRAASIFAFALTAAIFTCAAAGFAALAILSAVGEEHRALAAACIAAGLALIALAAILLMRQNLRDK